MLLNRYVHILFMDFKASGISAVYWPYGTISVVDEENQSIVCTHAVLITESNDAYNTMLETVATWVPKLKEITRVTRTDDLVSPDVLHLHLPSLQLPGLCNLHIRK